MKILSQLFHSQPTADPQPAVSEELRILKHDFKLLRHEFTLLERNVQDLSDKARRNLDKLRKQSQPRKDGKFAPEVPAESPNGDPAMLGDGDYTHEQIEKLARSQGLMQ